MYIIGMYTFDPQKSARTTHWLMRCGRFGMEQRITSEQVRFFMKVPNCVTLYIHSNSNMPRSLNIFTWPVGHPLGHFISFAFRSPKGRCFLSILHISSGHVMSELVEPRCHFLQKYDSPHMLCIFFSHAMPVLMCGRFGDFGNSNFGWCPVAKLGHENMRLVSIQKTIFDSC